MVTPSRSGDLSYEARMTADVAAITENPFGFSGRHTRDRSDEMVDMRRRLLVPWCEPRQRIEANRVQTEMC